MLATRADTDQDVWRALSNPVRRRILDLLREGPRSTGELAERFAPDLSRYAVMQHLGVLTEAGLVLPRQRGRRRLNHLNPVPIGAIHERWVSRFAEGAASAALALKRHLEDDRRGAMETDTSQRPARTVEIHSEIDVAAGRERVFRAITQEQQDWYPYSYGRDRLERIVFEPRVGGSTYEDWGDGAGIWYGTVVFYDPPTGYGTRGMLQGAITLEGWVTLEEHQDGTRIKHRMTAFGPIDDEMMKAIRTHGDLSLFADRIRAHCEGSA